MPVMLITGASRGIGAATARAAARNGWDVAVNYRSEQQNAEGLAAELVAEFGVRAAAVAGDVSIESDVLAMFDAARQISSDGESGLVILSSKPAMVHWYSGRRVLPTEVIPEDGTGTVREAIARFGVRRIVIGQLHPGDDRAARALLPICGELTVRRALPGETWMFDVSPPVAGDSACNVLKRRSTTRLLTRSTGRW